LLRLVHVFPGNAASRMPVTWKSRLVYHAARSGAGNPEIHLTEDRDAIYPVSRRSFWLLEDKKRSAEMDEKSK